MTATLCKAIVCKRKESFTAVIHNKLSGEFHGNVPLAMVETMNLWQSCSIQTECKKHAPDFSVMSSSLVINTT